MQKNDRYPDDQLRVKEGRWCSESHTFGLIATHSYEAN